MGIRFATVADVPAMVALGRIMYARTRFAKYQYEDEKVANALEHALTKGKDRYVCLVAENAKLEICGLLLATLDQHIFSHLLVASVMYYIVRPEDRLGGYGVRLLKAFEKWSSNRQVAEINLGINSEVQMEIVGRFVKKMGYSKVGENFVLSMRPLDDSVTLVNEL
jgi:L-amino acid N-acyltransferase YncA